MLPLRDHNPSTRPALVTYALIAVNIAVFLSYFPQLSSDQQALRFFNQWGIVPRQLVAGGDGFSLISAMFLHGGWMHLAGNMLFLWIFGDNLEETLGHWRYLGFYLLCGIVAALAQVMADTNSTVPTVGASGAIAGVMGGYLLLFPRARVDVLLVFVVFFRVFALPAWVLLVYWFAVQILGGSAADPSGGGVAYWAHAGGFVCGLVLMLPRWLRLGGPRFWARTHGTPPHPEARVRRTPIPAIRRKR
jgi:membrane associated rhomboid family serine protease